MATTPPVSTCAKLTCTPTKKFNLFSSGSYLQESLGFGGGKQFKKFSYAKVIYKNINTFTGKPSKHKVYRKSLRTLGDFESVIDETFGETEILKDPVTPNKAFERLGVFFNQFHINNFWFTSSNNLNLVYDNQTFVDGLKISGSNLNGTYAIVKANTSFTNRNSSYLPFNQDEQLSQSGSNFDSNFLIFYKDTDYSLSFRAYVIEKNISDTAKLKFYITSSVSGINKNLTYDQNRGVLIGEFAYSGSTAGKYFDQKQNFEFKFPEDLYGTLVVYPENVKQIVISDLSIKVSELFGYTGNSYYVKIPFPINVANEVFEIKSELYDINSNLSYTNLRTVQVFDPSGSSAAPDIGSATVINAGTINTNNLNVTSSITWQDPCGENQAPSSFNYFLVWNENSNQVCVMTSSAIGGGGGGGTITSIIGGPGVTIINGSGPIVTISASVGGGTGSGFPFTGSAVITGSLTVTGSIYSYNITSSLYGTSSWANNTVSSSYSLSSSYSNSSSFATTSSFTISSSFARSSSFAVSSSVATTSSFAVSSSYARSSSFSTTSSYANNGLPSGGLTNYILSKNSSTDFDTIWVPSPSGPSVQGEFSFTSSFLSSSLSSITCSSDYSFWHLHTNGNLNVHITSSVESGSFTIRLVSSGSTNNTINFYPYQLIEWSGVAGFDGPGSGSIEESGSITLSPTQEMVVSIVYYNTTSSLYPEKKYSAFVSDLKTPGLENKTIIPNLYLIGEGDYGIGGGGLTDPNAYIFTINGGGTEQDLSGIGSKTFWGWAPVYVVGTGRRFFPLYQ